MAGVPRRVAEERPRGGGRGAGGQARERRPPPPAELAFTPAVARRLFTGEAELATAQPVWRCVALSAMLLTISGGPQVPGPRPCHGWFSFGATRTTWTQLSVWYMMPSGKGIVHVHRYIDPTGKVQGPFFAADMIEWFKAVRAPAELLNFTSAHIASM